MAIKLETSLEGAISCAQLDYNGKRLALCTSDSNIKIYDYNNNIFKESSVVLSHHLSEVLSLSWSSPKFGSVLASSGNDNKILIWKEESSKLWNLAYEYTDSAPINSISFSPWELGLKLLAGLEDGNIIIFSFKEEWVSHKFLAHDCPVKSIAWGSALSIVESFHGNIEKLFRFVTGASDGKIKYWTLEDGAYNSENLDKHTGCVRDLSWNPCISANREVLASCADRNVIVWTRSTQEPLWKFKDVLSFPAPVLKISWNLQGNSLAVSAADNVTRIVRENIEENWKVMTQISQNGDVVDINEN